MEPIVRIINYLDLKYEQIKAKILNYILSPQSYFDFIKSLRKFNIISFDLNEIYFGYSNSKRYIISLLNCLFLWIAMFIMILIYALYGQLNQIYHLNEYFEHVKQMILLAIDGLFLAAMLKTDSIFEERKYNLRCFKLFYYLAHDLKHKHKLNDKNYKILTTFARITNLGSNLAIISDVAIILIFFIIWNLERINFDNWICFVSFIWILPECFIVFYFHEFNTFLFILLQIII